MRPLELTLLLLLPGAGLAQPVPASRPASTRPAATPAPAPAPSPLPRGPAAAAEPVEEVEARPSQGPSVFWSEDYPQIDRGVNLLLPTPVRRGALVLIVDHRTVQPLQENTWHDFFGFDAGGLKIGLGLRFGIFQRLDAGIYRLNGASERFDVYEFDLRYQLLRQEQQHIEVALRAGLTWFSQEDADDAVGGFGQLLLARRFFQRLTLSTGLLFHSDSTNGVKSSLDTGWSVAVPVIVDVRVLGWLGWNLELAANVAGYGTRNKRGPAGDQLSSFPSFSSSVRFVTNRHTFALLITNNSYTSSDGQVSNSPRGFDKLVVGFTITREWNLW